MSNSYNEKFHGPQPLMGKDLYKAFCEVGVFKKQKG